MKRLFRINHVDGPSYVKKVGVDVCFPTKTMAKAARNNLNAHTDLKYGFYVSKGPDHMGNHGSNPKSKSRYARVGA